MMLMSQIFKRSDLTEHNLSLLSPHRELICNFVFFGVLLSPDSSLGFRVPMLTSVKLSEGSGGHRKWKAEVVDRVLKLAGESK